MQKLQSGVLGKAVVESRHSRMPSLRLRELNGKRKNIRCKFLSQAWPTAGAPHHVLSNASSNKLERESAAVVWRASRHRSTAQFRIQVDIIERDHCVGEIGCLADTAQLSTRIVRPLWVVQVTEPVSPVTKATLPPAFPEDTSSRASTVSVSG